MDWMEAIVLGIVQGVTEFLPVSSKGHLAITQIAFDRLQGRSASGKENLFFAVMLHVGTVGAILFHSRHILASAMRGWFANPDLMPAEYRRAATIRATVFVVIATVPAVIAGVVFKKRVEAAFASLTATAIGFLFTASLLVWTHWRTSRSGQNAPSSSKTILEMTYWDALIVGLAQAVALMPGVSRSGMTVAAGLLAGLSRGWSVGFSLMISVPIILGAASKEILDEGLNVANGDFIARTLVAAIVAGIVGYLAILWLVQLVRSGKLWYCSVYLVVVATLVLIYSLSRNEGGPTHERESATLDRTLRDGHSRSIFRDPAMGSLVAVARADSVGSRSSDPAFDPSAPDLR